MKQQRRVLISGAGGLHPELIDSGVMPTVANWQRKAIGYPLLLVTASDYTYSQSGAPTSEALAPLIA